MSELAIVMPHDDDAEMSVIGSALIDNDTIGIVSDIITGEDFYNKLYGLMFDLIVDLYEAEMPVDLVTLNSKLNELDVPIENGTLMAIIDSVPTSANAKYYADIVSEKSITRRYITFFQDTVRKCYDAGTNMAEIIELSEANITQLALARNTEEFVHISKAVGEAIQRTKDASEKKSDIVGIPSGFIDLDRITKGFHNKELTIIAGRPRMGKTALVLNIARYIAVEQKRPVAIFSLEMDAENLARRLLSTQAHIDGESIMKGDLSDRQWSDLDEAAKILSAAGIYIDDVSDENIADLRAKCRKAKTKFGVQIIFIDYLQLIEGVGKSESRQQEVGNISGALRVLARQLEIPIIALAQLSRSVEARSEKIPMLSDLRESGKLEQDAQNVIFIHREEVYNDKTEKKDQADIIVAKNRDGPEGVATLKWIGSQVRFANMAKDDEPRSTIPSSPPAVVKKSEPKQMTIGKDFDGFVKVDANTPIPFD